MNKYLITITTEWGYVEQYTALSDCPFRTLDACWKTLKNVWQYYDLYVIAKDQYGYIDPNDIDITDHSKFTITEFKEDVLDDFEDYYMIYDQSDDLPF